MIKSMTGYGKAEAVLDEGKLTFEIRTLNSKNADINLKSSLLPKDKELLVRQKLAEQLYRGTIDFYITFEANAVEGSRKINTEAAKEYYRQISAMRQEVDGISGGTSGAYIWSTVMGLPDVLENKRKEIITEGNWPLIEQTIDQAIQAVNDYRSKEGEALYADITSRIRNILEFENGVEALEGERLATVKERLTKNLEELQQVPDQSRFEQELIYYIEKLDINEEKVRLRQHCKYFMDTIDNEPNPGKKLGFILQEMGREINTTGSKANHAGIQKLVVKMKDELEKMKEQSLNIL